MGAGYRDGREHRPAAGDRCQRGAEKIHAAAAVVAVHRRSTAAQIGERGERRVAGNDDEAAVQRTVATGHVVVRRSDVADRVPEILA